MTTWVGRYQNVKPSWTAAARDDGRSGGMKTGTLKHANLQS